MLVQFSIYPLDGGHISYDVARVTQILDKHQLPYEVGPLGTNIQGEWHRVMAALQQCHHEILREHSRVVTNIIIDDRQGKEHSLEGAVNSVYNQ